MHALIKRLLHGVAGANLLIIMVCVHGKAYADSFVLPDTPFPQTEFTNLLNITMYVTADLAALEQGILHEHDRSLLLDAVAGRIVRLHAVANRLCINHTWCTPYDEDLTCIADAVADLVVKYQLLMTDDTAHCYILLAEVNYKLQQLLGMKEVAECVIQ